METITHEPADGRLGDFLCASSKSDEGLDAFEMFGDSEMVFR